MEKEHRNMNVVLLYCQLRTGHFGAGTHIGNLLPAIQEQPDFRITIVKTDALQQKEVSCTTEGNMEVITVPQPENKFFVHGEDTALQHMYASRLINIIYPYLYEKPNLIFWINSVDYLNVGYALKEAFPDARILYVHHAWSWKCFVNVPDEVFAKEWAAGRAEFNPQAFKMNRYQQAIAELADDVVTVTQQAKTFYEQVLGVSNRKLTCIYNGIQDINRKQWNNDSLREKYGFRPEHKIILYTGRIKKEKGLHVLLAAFKQVLEHCPDARLVLAGFGDFADFIPEAGPHWCKIIFTGELPAEQLNEWYAMANIGVLPSLFEQCSFTAIEMRFSMLPLIVSDVDGLDELFEDNVDALKIHTYPDADTGEKQLNPNELAEKLQRLLTDSRLSSALAEQGYKKALTDFTAQKMQDAYLDLLRGMISPEKTGLQQKKDTIYTG